MELSRINSLLPKEFKYIGYAGAFLILLATLVTKFTSITYFNDLSYRPGILFIIALIVVMGSKSKVEDERVVQVRYYSYYILSGLFIGFMLVNEINHMYKSYLGHLSSFLSVYLLNYLYLYYKGSHWLIKNKNLHGAILFILCVVFIIFYNWLWA